MRRLLVVLCAIAACGDRDGGGGDEGDAAIAESDCFDGRDDNGDGMPDCADPSCASAAICVPEVPTGWSGYAALYAAAAAGPATCPAPYPTLVPAGDADPMGAPATCTSCSCGPTAGSSCPASGGAATTQPASWGRRGLACERAADSAAGCAAGDRCVPRSPPELTAGLCIRRDGDHACPAGRFTERHVLFASLDDTRQCTSCTCGPPMAGACAASGGQPIGAVTGTDPVTFCCIR